MNALLIFFILWAQGIPVQPTQGGTITGVLKDSAGKPAAGIRVGAVPRPDSIEEITGGASAMSSLAETDAQGRYALENVPPGRYFVAAGIVNFPTYYPGTQAMAEGRIITVIPGGVVSGIDFTLKDSSGGRMIGNAFGTGPSGFTVPLDIRAESGAKVPIFGAGQVTAVRIEPVGGGTAIRATINEPYLSLPQTNTDYRVRVEGLPDGYSVKTLKYGPTEIIDGILKVAAAAVIVSTGPAPQGAPLPPVMPNGVIVSSSAGFITYLNGILQSAVIQTQVPQTLSLVLTRAAIPRLPGVSVTGQFAPTIRGAFLSGAPVTIYVDHWFEIRGVQAGRHALVAVNSNSKATSAASIIVGDQDVNGIELEETTVLPLNARTPTPPGAAGNRPPGRLPLATVRGKIVDAETGEPLTQGDVFLVGDYWSGYPLRSDGTFEFGKLLPGKYEIEVKAVGYPTFRREFEIEEQDMDLQVKSN